MWPPGSPKVDPPDCSFDILSASSSGSAKRLFAVTGSTCRVENAEASCVPDKKATTPAIRISVLPIGAPLQGEKIVGQGRASQPSCPPGSSANHVVLGLPNPGGLLASSRPTRFPSSALSRRKKNPSKILRSLSWLAVPRGGWCWGSAAKCPIRPRGSRGAARSGARSQSNEAKRALRPSD
jgi:hypothetical protein